MDEWDVDVIEFKAQEYANKPQSELVRIFADMMKYIKQELRYNNANNAGGIATHLLALLVTCDGVLADKELQIVSDYSLLYENKDNIKSIKNYFNEAIQKRIYNEDALLKFCKSSKTMKENVFILAMCMYTYNGHMPNQKEMDLLRKIDSI